MARNKDCLVLLIDVSPSMHGVLPEIEQLIYSKYDEVGVVLFGTDETEYIMEDEEEEFQVYDHVFVSHNIQVVDQEAVDTVQNLERGNSRAAFMDAVEVGLDMLNKKYGTTNKGKKRMCVIPTARFPIQELSEGNKEYRVNSISQGMKSHGIKLETIIYRDPQFAPSESSQENDGLLARLSHEIVRVDNPTSLLGALKTRNVTPFTVFRGDLEISPIFKIKVWVYKKTSEEEFPRLKMYSDKRPESDKLVTHEAKVSVEYKSTTDQDKFVPEEQRIKGYQYGPHAVPVSEQEIEEMKLKLEKGVKLLGFTDGSNVKRHHYMKETYEFIPEPGNYKGGTVVSAIARAMEEDNKCVIIRCVWKKGQTSVVVGVLTPNVSSSPYIDSGSSGRDSAHSGYDSGSGIVADRSRIFSHRLRSS